MRNPTNVLFPVKVRWGCKPRPAAQMISKTLNGLRGLTLDKAIRKVPNENLASEQNKNKRLVKISLST
jgi:hypothetical protein